MQDKFNRVCIITCSDTYEKIRADFVYKYFKNAGADVVVHTTDFLHIEKCKRTDLKENYIMHSTISYKKNLSYARIHSHMKLAEDIFREIADEKFDLLWVILPPNSLAKQAAIYKKHHQETKLVFDIVDLWPESMPLQKLMKTPPVAYWRKLRDKNLDAADKIVTECKLFQTKLSKNISRDKLEVLYLGRKPENAEVNEKNLPEDVLRLCYLGSINNIIDIPATKEILENLAKVRPVELEIIGDGEKREEFIEVAKQSGASVHYRGLVYDFQEKKQIFDSCHFGLNIMKQSVVVGLTMKSMDYFEFGLPIINNIHGDTWDFVNEKRLGVNVEPGFENKVIDFLKDKNSGKRAKEFYDKNLSEDAGNKRLAKILEDL